MSKYKTVRVPAVLPMSQGSMYEIFRLFIEPLIDLKPPTRTSEDWRDTVFHAQTRAIRQFEAKVKFKMPGYLVPEDEVLLDPREAPRSTSRMVRAGERIFARIDVGIPDLVEVEINRQGDGQHIYELSAADWSTVKDALTPIAPCMKKHKDRTWAYYKTKRLLRGED